MKNSKELLNKAGILPKLRLGLRLPAGGVKPTGPHRVTVLEDRIIKKVDPKDGKDKEWVSYTVQENGEKKVYDTLLRDKNGGLSYLVQRFAEINEGDEVILEMKKQGAKNYIEISLPTHSSTTEVDEDDSENEPPLSEEEVENIPM